MCNILCIANGVVHYLSAPAVSPLGACEVDRVALLSLADKHAVVQINGINPCAPLDEARSIVAQHDGHRFRAAATHAHKDDYSHTHSLAYNP